MRTGFLSGGAEGIRTPDLLIANETRYQLRHSPKRGETVAPPLGAHRIRIPLAGPASDYGLSDASDSPDTVSGRSP